VIVPISGKELAKLFKKHGYEEVKGGGKGSHMKLRKGNKTVIIPGHKELKKGLEMALKKQLEGDK
jgi:predicted RNA binding protein YcfA (HicA-like mRNA interferase family)